MNVKVIYCNEEIPEVKSSESILGFLGMEVRNHYHPAIRPNKLLDDELKTLMKNPR